MNNEPQLSDGGSLTQASTYWRLMRFFNLYRCIIAAIFISSHFFLQERVWNVQYNGTLYFKLAVSYLAVSLLAAGFT